MRPGSLTGGKSVTGGKLQYFPGNLRVNTEITENNLSCGNALPGNSEPSRVGTTALSIMTCGIMTNVCVEGGDGTDLVENSGDRGSIADLRIIIIVGSPHHVSRQRRWYDHRPRH